MLFIRGIIGSGYNRRDPASRDSGHVVLPPRASRRPLAQPKDRSLPSQQTDLKPLDPALECGTWLAGAKVLPGVEEDARWNTPDSVQRVMLPMGKPSAICQLRHVCEGA